MRSDTNSSLDPERPEPGVQPFGVGSDDKIPKRSPNWAAKCTELAPGPTTGTSTRSRSAARPGSLKHPITTAS